MAYAPLARPSYTSIAASTTGILTASAGVWRSRLLFDQTHVIAKEVILQPRSEFVAFEALMNDMFQNGERGNAH
jgi:hypothetical protein